jgi:hypothetical protein
VVVLIEPILVHIDNLLKEQHESSNGEVKAMMQIKHHRLNLEPVEERNPLMSC